MLAEQGIVAARRRARDPRRRSTRSRTDDVRARQLRRHLRGSVLLRRAADRRRRAARTSPAGCTPRARRNDIDMTMYRMRQREFILGAARRRRSSCAASLLDSRRPASRDGLRRAHAHAAGAADDVAHYLLAVDRAARARRRAARRRPTRARTAIRSAPARSPAPAFRSIASCTGELLGFDGPTGNTYGSIATVDYLLESVVGDGGAARPASAASCRTCCSGARREFGYLRLGDGFVQCSSIMPQKRNPVALEHARAIGSKALGQAQAIVARRPQHAVRRHRRHRGRSAAARACRCSATRSGRSGWWPRRCRPPSSTAQRLAERAGQGWTTVTELADTLVRDHGLPFRRSHAIAARLVAEASRRPGAPLEQVLADVSKEVLGRRRSTYTAAALAEILSPRHFVGSGRRRRTGAVRDRARLRRVDRRCWQRRAMARRDRGKASRRRRGTPGRDRCRAVGLGSRVCGAGAEAVSGSGSTSV